MNSQILGQFGFFCTSLYFLVDTKFRKSHKDFSNDCPQCAGVGGRADFEVFVKSLGATQLSRRAAIAFMRK